MATEDDELVRANIIITATLRDFGQYKKEFYVGRFLATWWLKSAFYFIACS